MPNKRERRRASGNVFMDFLTSRPQVNGDRKQTKPNNVKPIKHVFIAIADFLTIRIWRARSIAQESGF